MSKKYLGVDILHLAVTAVYIVGALAFGLYCIIAHSCVGWGLLFFPLLAGVSLAALLLRRRIRAVSALLRKVYNIVVIVLCVIALIFAVTFTWYYVYVETFVPPSPSQPVDVIIVPGARAYGNTPGQTLQNRLDETLLQLEKYPGAVAVVSGGQGPNETAPESSAMFKYLTDKGVDPERVLMDTYSHNTLQNLKNSIAIASLRGVPTGAVLIVTSDYHMPRALMIAHRLGINAYGVVAWTRSSSYAFDAIRDYVGLIKSWLFDGR